jgi:hypothetical protein
MEIPASPSQKGVIIVATSFGYEQVFSVDVEICFAQRSSARKNYVRSLQKMKEGVEWSTDTTVSYTAESRR